MALTDITEQPTGSSCTNAILFASCKAAVTALQQRQPGAWQLVAQAVSAAASAAVTDVHNNADVPLPLPWSKGVESELLKLIKEAVACAPAAAKATASADTAAAVHNALSATINLVASLLQGHRWPALQSWVFLEQGMLRIIHATLAMLPAAASVPTFAALDAASHLAVTFGEISASMSSDGMEALQRSSADMHAKFLRESRQMLRTHNGSANVQCLVQEWTKDLERHILRQEPGPRPSWWHVTSLVILLPIFLFLPMVLPHILRTMVVSS